MILRERNVRGTYYIESKAKDNVMYTRRMSPFVRENDHGRTALAPVFFVVDDGDDDSRGWDGASNDGEVSNRPVRFPFVPGWRSSGTHDVGEDG